MANCSQSYDKLEYMFNFKANYYKYNIYDNLYAQELQSII